MKKLLFILFIGFSFTTFAQEMVTDRPDQTESANIVTKGFLQIEAGGLAERDALNDNLNSAAVLFRYGFNDKIELRLGFDQQWLYPQANSDVLRGLAPLTAGFKLALSEESCWLPKTALLTTFSIPFLDHVLQSEYAGIDIRLTGEHTINDKSGIGWNLGTAWNGDDAFSTAWYSVVYGYDLLPFLGIFTEIYGEIGPAPDTFNFDAGFTVPVKDKLQFDVYGGVGLNDSANDFILGIGVSYLLPISKSTN